MLKNLCLSATIALLSFATIMPSNTHIAGAKADIMIEMKTAWLLHARAEKHFQDILQDQYESTKLQCLQALSIIASSPEFASTLEQVTDAQVKLITQDMVKYNDIVVEPSAFPLEQKVKEVLKLAAFDETTAQLFNVFYVVFAITQGSKMLLEKLELATNQANNA